VNSDEILKAELAKARAAVGEIALTANEYKTALSLGDDYWLYIVFNCASQPKITTIQNPARFDWQPLSKIDCYRLGSETILKSQLRQPLNTSGRQSRRVE
jgi:hypothetical protein